MSFATIGANSWQFSGKIAGTLGKGCRVQKASTTTGTTTTPAQARAKTHLLIVLKDKKYAKKE
jgi:hypothetical protein